MDKQQLLSEIGAMARQGELSRDEVLAAMALGGSPTEDIIRHPLGISDVMYYIGGAIVFLGVCVLAYQNWDNFSSGLRILITLGSSIACFVTAALLYKYENLRKVSQSFF